jgi:hypothetical protein
MYYLVEAETAYPEPKPVLNLRGVSHADAAEIFEEKIDLFKHVFPDFESMDFIESYQTKTGIDLKKACDPITVDGYRLQVCRMDFIVSLFVDEQKKPETFFEKRIFDRLAWDPHRMALRDSLSGDTEILRRGPWVRRSKEYWDKFWVNTEKKWRASKKESTQILTLLKELFERINQCTDFNSIEHMLDQVKRHSRGTPNEVHKYIIEILEIRAEKARSNA